MRTVSVTEYVLLFLKSIQLKEVALGMAVLCLLLLIIELLEIGIKGLLLIGGCIVLIKITMALINSLAAWFGRTDSEFLHSYI